jgi:malate dehydrogenase (oxaloacetate-decarboxylating)
LPSFFPQRIIRYNGLSVAKWYHLRTDEERDKKPTKRLFMAQFTLMRNIEGLISHIETDLQGYELLSNSKLNKGCAFTHDERRAFRLEGLLPHQVESLEQQVARMYAQYNEHRTDLSKNIYLNVLHDYNETLFYHLVNQYLEEMLPIIYTPTVGYAVERFSLEHRKTRGLYLSFPDRNRLKDIIDQQIHRPIDLTVVTDGEGVLGIGDQGIGGINISSAKLMVYTLCAGLNPHAVIPIQLDVGTNNPNLLSDPMYLGWRHERITGQAYMDFIDEFVTAITAKFPNIYVHWEDFGRDNARNILTQYREKICTLNGDMQSTGVIALACVLAGMAALDIPMKDHKIVIFGAGTAGIGIADQIHAAYLRAGLSSAAAYERFWVIDRDGLLLHNSKNLLDFQKPYARNPAETSAWQVKDREHLSLEDVVENVKPTILIGCSTVKNAFNEKIVRKMASYLERPFIMPLSNPTSKSEAIPEDLLRWTDGRAIIATGSPFLNTQFNGRPFRIAQSNNAFAFPGIGLGAVAVKAKYISDGMLNAATMALSQSAPILQNKSAPLLPKISETHSVSRQVAFAVALQAKAEGLAQIDPAIELNHAMNAVTWEPRYYPYRHRSG